MDFATWSPVPWTSEQKEPLPVMAAKARFLGMQTLQTQWNTQVGLFDIFMCCPSCTSTLYILRPRQPTPRESEWLGMLSCFPRRASFPPYHSSPRLTSKSRWQDTVFGGNICFFAGKILQCGRLWNRRPSQLDSGRHDQSSL